MSFYRSIFANWSENFGNVKQGFLGFEIGDAQRHDEQSAAAQHEARDGVHVWAMRVFMGYRG